MTSHGEKKIVQEGRIKEWKSHQGNEEQNSLQKQQVLYSIFYSAWNIMNIMYYDIW